MPRKPATDALARQIGARIRALREEAGITQERLAWDCDLAKPYVSQVEAGKRVPSVPVLFALAKRLECDAGDLLIFDLENPRQSLIEASRSATRGGIRLALRSLKG